jgi:YHS domain-containing protein
LKSFPRRAAGALAAAALLVGCNAMVAQNPPSPMRPVNAMRDGDESRLMLRGYDVVAYAAQARALPGSPQWSTEFEGVRYLFASAEHQALFLQNPSKWQPAYHGWDAMRMVFAIPEPADPAVWKLIDGRVFLFADAASKAAFELDVAGNKAAADKYWAAEVRGSFSPWQRSYRLLDRVPGYKSPEELARAVAAAQAKPG